MESLHASFDKIDGKVKVMIAKGSTDSELACCIRKAWTEQFHMSLSVPAVKGMILHYRSVHKGARKTRKAGRGQRGGMAPIDWTGGHAAPGSHQKGAGILDAIMMGHAPASVPRNFIETGVSTVQGAPIRDPNASPISATTHMATFTPRAYDAGAISSITSLAPLYKPY